MSRLRDHRSRMDGSHCPDSAGCARLFHDSIQSGLSVGDTCECCGQPVIPAPTWEAVKGIDRRRVVYYRLERHNGTYAGAVSKKDDGWRALAYGPDGRQGRAHEGRTELGMHPTRRAAQRAVEDYEAAR